MDLGDTLLNPRRLDSKDEKETRSTDFTLTAFHKCGAAKEMVPSPMVVDFILAKEGLAGSLKSKWMKCSRCHWSATPSIPHHWVSWLEWMAIGKVFSNIMGSSEW